MRFLEDPDLKFGVPLDSCKTLGPKQSDVALEECINYLQISLEHAAELWALGDPENPSAREALHSMLGVM